MTLPEESLAFISDEATFLNPDQASTTIAELARSLASSGVNSIFR